MTPQDLIASIQKTLTPDLLRPEYRAKNKGNPLYGHCYTASEALFHLLKEHFPKLEFKPCRGRDDAGVVHGWLVNDKGDILDPTAEQYRRRNDRNVFSRGLTGRRGGHESLVFVECRRSGSNRHALGAADFESAASAIPPLRPGQDGGVPAPSGGGQGQPARPW